MPWFNKDGLNIRFGLEKVSNTNPRGESPGAGIYRDIGVLLDLTKTTAATVYVLSGDVIGSNSEIISIQSDVVTAAVGTTALTFGLQYYDGTEYDYDGFLTAVTGLTTAGTSTTYVKGTSGAGALVGTVTARPGQLVVTPTGQGTAGIVQLTVRVFVPKKNPIPVVNI